MSLSVHTLAYLGPLLPPSFDVHAESRSLSFQQSSFLSFLKQLWKSDWAHSKDAAPYDLTLQSADERESAEEGYLHHKTFYRSHVTVMVILVFLIACRSSKSVSSDEKSKHKQSSPQTLAEPIDFPSSLYCCKIDRQLRFRYATTPTFFSIRNCLD